MQKGGGGISQTQFREGGVLLCLAGLVDQTSNIRRSLEDIFCQLFITAALPDWGGCLIIVELGRLKLLIP